MANLRTKKQLPISTLAMLAITAASLIFGGYYFRQYNQLKDTQNKSVEEVNKELVDKINKVYELPTGETPTIVNVAKDPKDFTTEQEKMFSAAFKNLKSGDIVLLYEKAGKAIQYRLSENKVIDTATLTVNAATKVQIIGSADAQNQTEAKLLAAFPNKLQVASKSTPNGTYTAVTVVDVTGQNAELAKQVAATVGGSVVTALPATEKAADGAQIVVIVGETTTPAAQ